MTDLTGLTDDALSEQLVAAADHLAVATVELTRRRTFVDKINFGEVATVGQVAGWMVRGTMVPLILVHWRAAIADYVLPEGFDPMAPMIDSPSTGKEYSLPDQLLMALLSSVCIPEEIVQMSAQQRATHLAILCSALATFCANTSMRLARAGLDPLDYHPLGHLAQTMALIRTALDACREYYRSRHGDDASERIERLLHEAFAQVMAAKGEAKPADPDEPS